jgi:hypothetical protein
MRQGFSPWRAEHTVQNPTGDEFTLVSMNDTCHLRRG